MAPAEHPTVEEPNSIEEDTSSEQYWDGVNRFD
jgi:hypothetical protein